MHDINCEQRSLGDTPVSVPRYRIGYPISELSFQMKKKNKIEGAQWHHIIQPESVKVSSNFIQRFQMSKIVDKNLGRTNERTNEGNEERTDTMNSIHFALHPSDVKTKQEQHNGIM